jgi:hypothetical protein
MELYMIHVSTLNLVDCRDNIRWTWTRSSLFTVRSMYEQLTQIESGASHKHIWKAKIPSKIKYFLWLLENDAIFTKVNMIKRKWKGHPTCYICNENGTVSHLFFECEVVNSN